MSSTPHPAINPAIVPLSVLCAGLVLGGIAAVYITHRIARTRLLLQLRLAAEAEAAEKKIGEKPVLVDVYVGPCPNRAAAQYADVSWSSLQPISTAMQASMSSPHPHHSIQKRPGYTRTPLVDGNVLQVSVGIAMPKPSSSGEAGASLESLEYCLGTSDVVVCSLLGARHRLIGIN